MYRAEAVSVNTETHLEWASGPLETNWGTNPAAEGQLGRGTNDRPLNQTQT